MGKGEHGHAVDRTRNVMQGRVVLFFISPPWPQHNVVGIAYSLRPLASSWRSKSPMLARAHSGFFSAAMCRRWGNVPRRGRSLAARLHNCTLNFPRWKRAAFIEGADRTAYP